MKTALLLMLLVISSYAFAASGSPKGKITGYYTGWGNDSVRVTIEGAAYIE